MWLDADLKYPYSTGENVEEIFARDVPGFVAGASNDNKIASPDNWRDVDYDAYFQTVVKLSGTRISDECEWTVDFQLEEDSGVWSVNGNHTP